MDDLKAAAYYDELTRKGEGAARFKQGLGFSSSLTQDPFPAKSSALPSCSSSSSSFLSTFVKASNTESASKIQKQSELRNIQNKLRKKPTEDENLNPRVPDYDDTQRRSKRRSWSRSRSRSRDREGYSRRSKSRSRSRSRERSRRSIRPRIKDMDRVRERGSDKEGEINKERRRRRRSRSWSDEEQWQRKERGNLSKERKVEKSENDRRSGEERNGKIDYSRLIEGYNKMSPAERVKAKIKLQLAESVEKDADKGMGSGWERFEFNKDAPLDDEEEIEAAEDDVELVKHIGHSFRFSAVEARKKDQIRVAHDEAMFGALSFPLSANTENEPEGGTEETNERDSSVNRLTEEVLANEKGCWRDRLRKLKNDD